MVGNTIFFQSFSLATHKHDFRIIALRRKHRNFLSRVPRKGSTDFQHFPVGIDSRLLMQTHRTEQMVFWELLGY